MKKITKGEFLERCADVHGNKYDYSLIEYINMTTKIHILCPNHGVFSQKPKDHIKGRGCYDCGVESIKSKQKDSVNDFITKAMEIHGDRYDYSKTNYENARTQIVITCREHGDFNLTPDAHLRRKRGCKKCSMIKKKKSRVCFLYHKKYSNIQQPEEYKLIPLTQGEFAKVDNEDFEYISRYSWNITFQGYAYNRTLGYMHRLINNTPEHMHTDHVNNMRTDNRKVNLRTCTIAENNRNTSPARGSSSKYKGVTSHQGKYIFQIRKSGVYYRGTYETEKEAALAYNKKAMELFGEFAYLNKI